MKARRYTLFLKQSPLWFIAGLAALFFSLIGFRALSTPDEGRYTEIAREMLMHHNFLTPHLNNLLYFEKPPLFYWLNTFSQYLLGFNHFAFRFANAFMSFATCIITYFSGCYLFNRNTARLSVGILACNILFFGMSQYISLDTTLTFFITATLFSFLCYLHSDQTKHRYPNPILLYTGYISFGLAVLTKGLVGLLLPGAVIFLWLMLRRQWRTLRHMHLVQGAFLFLLVVLPWHIAMTIKHPGFFNFYVIQQQFLRYFTSIAHREAPFFYYLPVFIVGFFPWICWIYPVIKDSSRHPLKRCLWIWMGTIFLFFSFSQSKLIPYILPMFPAAALLFADTIQRSSKKYLLICFIAIIPLMMIGIFVPPYVKDRSMASLTHALKHPIPDNAIVVSYDHYYQDLPVYTQRPVWVVNWTNEFQFGMEHQSQNWIMSMHDFWNKYKSRTKQSYYLFTTHTSWKEIPVQYRREFHLLAENRLNVVITNKKD